MQDSPKAILVSVEEFIKRTHPTEFWLSPEEIHVLIAVLRSHGAHDSLFARMQTPEARTAMKAAYAASSKELGRAAVIAARKPAIATRKRG